MTDQQHVLVAKTFISNPENKHSVNHINTIKHDNRVCNLEWATYQEQNYKENKKPYKNPNSAKAVYQMDLNGNIIKQWDKIKDAEIALKISSKNICKVLAGKRTHTGGFKWKYVEIDDFIEGEVWKQVPLGKDYQEVYASSMGRIRKKNKLTKVTSGNKRECGYCDIDIYSNKEQKYKSFRVHRLICMAFHENPENKPFVNHKDLDKSNNHESNLEWVTNKENINHYITTTTIARKNSRSKIVYQYDLQGNFVNKYDTIVEASKATNVSQACISCCCVMKSKTAGGFVFSYTEKI